MKGYNVTLLDASAVRAINRAGWTPLGGRGNATSRPTAYVRRGGSGSRAGANATRLTAHVMLLLSSASRIEHVQRLVATHPAMDFVLHPSVRPQNLVAAAVDVGAHIAPKGAQISVTGIANVISHARLLQHFLATSEPELLALEDDAFLVPDFEARYAAFRSALPRDFDMCQLYHHPWSKKGRQRQEQLLQKQVQKPLLLLQQLAQQEHRKQQQAPQQAREVGAGEDGGGGGGGGPDEVRSYPSEYYESYAPYGTLGLLFSRRGARIALERLRRVDDKVDMMLRPLVWSRKVRSYMPTADLMYANESAIPSAIGYPSRRFGWR